MKPPPSPLTWAISGRSPSWGAWIETVRRRMACLCCKVAPPRGERGLKRWGGITAPPRRCRRSPSWGAWIETLGQFRCAAGTAGRSPSWGAWIETSFHCLQYGIRHCRSPSWGAWIETRREVIYVYGRRSRSPSWGAWIETRTGSAATTSARVAPPRGERGLKPAVTLLR